MNENEFSEEDDEGSEEEVIGETESIFVTIESEYKTILEKIQEKDDNAEIAEAYTKLFESFAETYKNEKDLINKTITHADQITCALEQLDLMRSSADSDVGVIKDLRDDVKNARKIADNAVVREQQVQEIVENMRTQIVKLNTELELKSRISGDADEDMGVSKTKEGFEREKQRMIDEITSLKQKLVNSLSYSEELERKNSAADLKTNELNNLLDQELTESAKKQRQIETLDAEIAVLKGDYETLREQVETSNDSLETSNKERAAFEAQLKEQKVATEKASKNAEIIQIKYDKVQSEHDAIKIEYEDVTEKYLAQTRLYKLKTDETNHLHIEINKTIKLKEVSERKVRGLERAKYLLESEKEKMKGNVGIMERECVLSKRQTEQDAKQIDTLSKEKEILHKNLIRIQGAIDQHAKLIKIQEQSKRKLEGDVRNLHHELVAQKKIGFRLEKEKIKAVEGTLDLTQQIEDSMDEMKLKQQVIFDQKKIISEVESRLQQQQNLFESVRIERNSFQKQVQDALAEVSEFKFKLKIANHQSEQLKEDISTKEKIILKEENVLRKVNKEKDNLKLEVQAGLTQIHRLKSELDVYKEKEKTLAKHILIAESELKKHLKQIEQIMNDRDVIGAQLVRRNDEIGLLYDKINILEVTLHRGEYHYEKRLDDIRLLKLEIQKIRQERDSLEKCISNMTDLKHEVFQLERELAQERLKCRALEEELQHPLNIHRWRKLEGSDPQIVELLRKIQILQKRLLNQTSESIEREKQLKEVEQLYLSLRQMVSHQPGADVKTELVKTQRALALRGAKMKCLISELNMYETQANEFKMDVNKISKELKETKSKYYKQKKACETHSLHDTKLPAIKSDNSSLQQHKFTGGGFKIQP